MNLFTNWKKTFLSKKDKSNKGGIDIPIKHLIETINRKENYFTTSSCSGRIVIIIEPKSGLKKDVDFLYETHAKASLKALKSRLKSKEKHTLWFRFEPMILHVNCKTLDDANGLVEKAQPFFKHSGIIAAKKKTILEIRGSEFIEAPIAKDRKSLVDDGYLKTLVNEANKKLRRTHEKINALANVLEHQKVETHIERSEVSSSF